MKRILFLGLITTGLIASCEYEYKEFVKNKNTTYDIIKYDAGDIQTCSSNNFTIMKAIRTKQECKDKTIQDEVLKFLDGDGKMIKETCIKFGYK